MTYEIISPYLSSVCPCCLFCHHTKLGSITICEGGTYDIQASSLGWGYIATALYMQGGTFSDTSGKTSAAAPGTSAFVTEMQGGDSTFDMSGSKISYFSFNTLQGQTGTDTSDGTLTLIGNSSISGQYFLFSSIDNVDGSLIAGGGMDVYVKTVNLDVADAVITQVALGANTDIVLGGSEASTIAKLVLDSNATLSLTNENTSITSVQSVDDTAVINIGTADQALDYTGTVNIAEDSSLSLYKDINESITFSSNDSTATLILDGDTFTTTADTFVNYSGGIELESGHLILANQDVSISNIGTISMAAGTELTMEQTVSLFSATSSLKVLVTGGDSAERAMPTSTLNRAPSTCAASPLVQKMMPTSPKRAKAHFCSITPTPSTPAAVMSASILQKAVSKSTKRRPAVPMTLPLKVSPLEKGQAFYGLPSTMALSVPLQAQAASP